MSNRFFTLPCAPLYPEVLRIDDRGFASPSFHCLSKIIGIDPWRHLVLNNMYLRQYGAQKLRNVKYRSISKNSTCPQHEMRYARKFRANFARSFLLFKLT